MKIRNHINITRDYSDTISPILFKRTAHTSISMNISVEDSKGQSADFSRAAGYGGEASLTCLSDDGKLRSTTINTGLENKVVTALNLTTVDGKNAEHFFKQGDGFWSNIKDYLPHLADYSHRASKTFPTTSDISPLDVICNAPDVRQKLKTNGL